MHKILNSSTTATELEAHRSVESRVCGRSFGGHRGRSRLSRHDLADVALFFLLLIAGHACLLCHVLRSLLHAKSAHLKQP
jgi:hypothetical protein